jgi:VanZ family protein
VKKTILQVLVLASLVMLVIPDFHPERWYSNGYHVWLDIVQHSGYFFAFTMAMLWVFPAVRKPIPWFFIIVLIATSLEVIQLWIPKRSFSPMDMCSNLLGISVAYGCWWLFSRSRNRSDAASRK